MKINPAPTIVIILAAFLLLSATTSSQEPLEQGAVRQTGDALEVWHEAIGWVSPESYFNYEIKRLGGPTYGTVVRYPPYATVKQWETLIDRLPDGRTCPMVFFHQRWRRLPDVLALDDRLRNYGGCRDVFKH